MRAGRPGGSYSHDARGRSSGDGKHLSCLRSSWRSRTCHSRSVRATEEHRFLTLQVEERPDAGECVAADEERPPSVMIKELEIAVDLSRSP